MREYKKKFIDLLFKTNALKIDKTYKTKSGRKSPYFINMGEMSTGSGLTGMGTAYAQAIREKEILFDSIHGIPYKGIPIATAAAIQLHKIDNGMDPLMTYTRKEGAKSYGENTDKKSIFVGKESAKNSTLPLGLLLIDDVGSTYRTKIEEIEKMEKELPNPKFTDLFIGVDRQEIDEDGKDARKSFEEKTKIKVHSIVNTSEIMEYMKKTSIFDMGRRGIDQSINPANVLKMEEYLRKYGTEDVKKKLNLISQ